MSMFEQEWDDDLKLFISLTNKYNVRMLMVGGGAVNFHGYQRHSADVDFWIDVKEDNLKRLLVVFKEMGYKIEDFPEDVKKTEQNISLKFSPTSLNLELITRFSINKTFEEAFHDSVPVIINEKTLLCWKVLSYEDLITSKIKSSRPKDFLDIQEMERRRNK